jgi:hypothetical protein
MYQQVCSKVDAHTAFFFFTGEMKNKKIENSSVFGGFLSPPESEEKNSKKHWIPVFVFWYIAKYMKG